MKLTTSSLMLKKPLFWEMFLLIVIMGSLNHIAYVFHLYWSIYEFDSIVHFFGGMAMSMLFLWFYFSSGFFDPPKRSFVKFLLISMLGAMFIAVSWEIFEFTLGEVIIKEADYPYDVTMDLIMDFLGAIAGCLYAYMKEHE